MPNLQNQLELDRCPHCGVDRPRLTGTFHTETKDHRGENIRLWRAFTCGRCGGVVIAAAAAHGMPVLEMYPAPTEVDEAIPATAKAYLSQALSSLHAPAGAVMLAASAVDAMLKAKGYKDGHLYPRIKKAAQDHVITESMAQWAHEVRLDANDQRHADEEASLPTTADARKCVDFALALGQFMFVLPARVARGLEAAKSKA